MDMLSVAKTPLSTNSIPNNSDLLTISMNDLKPRSSNTSKMKDGTEFRRKKKINY